MGAPLLNDLVYRPLVERGISQETCEKFGYGVTTLGGETVQVAPYYDESGRLTGQKVRPKDKSGIRFKGSNPGTLFGQQLFSPNEKLRVVITEGEIDAMSVYETQGDWPVLSVPSGAQSAAKVCAAHLEYLRGFKEVIVCFDMDEPGRKATEEVAMLFPGQAKVVTLDLKDANEYLKVGRKADLRKALWAAKLWRPDGLVAASDLWEEVSSPVPPAIANYPWGFLDEALGGIRESSLVMFTAGSGIGKSTVTREIAYSLTQKGMKVGVIALEESCKESVLYQMGIHLGKHLHLGNHGVSTEELREAFDCVTENLVLYDHFGSCEVSRLEAIVTSLAAEGCKILVIDHVSMVVSGLESGNERKDLDILMTSLRSVAERQGITILGVSHIKRLPEGRSEIKLTDLRGSAALEQLSDAVISLERSDNSTTVRVLKNRAKGWIMGKIGSLQYDPDIGRLVEVPENFEEEKDCDF